MKEIALHIMDIVQNSISANADIIEVTINISHKNDTLDLIIQDNGRGMDEEMLQNVTSPFVTTRTTRRVGLGISLLSAGAQGTGGKFSIASELGKGTRVWAVYKLGHIDRPPIGDFGGTMYTLMICNPNIDFRVEFNVDGENNAIDTREVREVLGADIPINSPDVSLWLKENFDELFPSEYAEL